MVQRTPNIPPNTLAVNHKGVVLNNDFKNLLLVINFGLNICSY